MSNEIFEPLYTANKSLSHKLLWNKSRPWFRFEGKCLKQKDTTPFTLNNVVNLIVYKLDRWSPGLNTDFTPKNWLFGTVKLTKNADADKYKYCCYSIRVWFTLRILFTWC